MKTIIFIFLLPALLCGGCGEDPHNTVGTTAVWVLHDISDTMLRPPTPTDINALLKPTTNIWSGMEVYSRVINDKSINPMHRYVLPPADRLLENEDFRRAKVNRFTKMVSDSLGSLSPHGIILYKKSIILESISSTIQNIRANHASSKHLIVYSDLRENHYLNFYEAETLKAIEQSPEKVAEIIETHYPLPDMAGINIWLVYQPKDYHDNNTYMLIAHFLEKLFTAKGASVHITQTVG